MFARRKNARLGSIGHVARYDGRHDQARDNGSRPIKNLLSALPSHSRSWHLTLHLNLSRNMPLPMVGAINRLIVPYREISNPKGPDRR